MGKWTLKVVPETRICERPVCGKPFTPRRHKNVSRYCSPNCYAQAWRAQNRDKYRAYQAKNYYKHHGKSEARWQVKLALLEGRLVKPKTCSECGQAKRYIEAHHHNGHDEAHWLDVVWLCKPCHGQKHRKPRAQRCVFGCARIATQRVGEEYAMCDRCDGLVTRIIESMPARIVA